MIMSRNDDGTYSQVGFIKDNSGADIEYIKDKDGVILFEKGFTREKSGALPLQLDGIEKPLKDYNIKGNIYQAENVTSDSPQEVVGAGERTGNLFDKNASDRNLRGYVQSNGVIADSQNFYTSGYIKISGMSAVTISGMGAGLNPSYCLYDENKQLIRGVKYDGNETITASITTEYYIRFSYRIANADIAMLNSGSTPLPYEPYGYKISVESRGKNLFNGEIQQGSLTDANGGEGNHTTRVRTSAVSVNPNETYTISSNLLLRNIILLKDGVFVETVPCYESVVSTYTFTVPDNANQVRASFRGNSAGDMDITPDNLEWLMLELGSTATSYEPYQEPLTTPIYLDSPLYKIGDYVDSRCKTEEVRTVRELVLTGEEEWKKSNTYKGSFYARVLTDLRSTFDDAYCTHTIQTKTISSSTYVYGNFAFESASESPIFNIFIGQPEWTVDDFKGYLTAQYANGTPVTVYYVLATPETKAVEPMEIPTLNGTTIIEAETTVQPSEMHIKYKSRT